MNPSIRSIFPGLPPLDERSLTERIISVTKWSESRCLAGADRPGQESSDEGSRISGLPASCRVRALSPRCLDPDDMGMMVFGEGSEPSPVP